MQAQAVYKPKGGAIEYMPLSLYRHSVRQVLLHVVKLIKKRAVAGSSTRLIKVGAHWGGPLNEAADELASAAAESDSAIPAGRE